MNIRIHIERLVLEGLEMGAGDGAKVKRAVEAELSRLLSARGVAPSLHGGGALARIQANPVSMAKDTDPETLGERIASSVYGGIGK